MLHTLCSIPWASWRTLYLGSLTKVGASCACLSNSYRHHTCSFPPGRLTGLLCPPEGGGCPLLHYFSNELGTQRECYTFFVTPPGRPWRTILPHKGSFNESGASLAFSDLLREEDTTHFVNALLGVLGLLASGRSL
jgi:hypothetical protein